jgi:signal transduction histidine kinase/PAS domain-containing protein
MSAFTKSRNRFFFILCCTTLLVSKTHASEIVINPDISRINLNNALEYYEDATKTLTINEIASERFHDKFHTPIDGNVNFGLTKSVYWVRVKLKQKMAAPDKLILEIPYSHMRHIALYEPTTYDSGRVEYEVRHSGFSVPFNKRDLKFRNSAFTLTLDENNAAKTLYLRFQTDGPMWFPMTIWRANVFEESKKTEIYFLGIYFGLIFAMLFYNAFLCITLRDITYLYYILYVSSVAVLFSSITGLGFQYLWPEHPKFAYICPSMWTGCAAFFLSLFTRIFLKAKTNIPHGDKLIRFLIWYWGTTTLPLFLIQYFLGVGFFVYQVAACLSMACFLVIGFVALRHGFASARFYILSFFVFLVGGITFILRNIGWVPANDISTYGVMVGSAVEVILLSTALADRINHLKREKMAAQLEIVKNKELAVQALKEANHALQQEIERRNQTEASLFESREKYRALFESLPIGVIFTDTRGRIIETNHDSINGEMFNPLYLNSPDNGIQMITPNGNPLKKRDRPAFRSLKSQQAVHNVEIGIIKSDAENLPAPPRWFSVTATPLSMAGFGAIVIYIDITNQINLEMQRRQQQADLSRASRFNTMGEMASALAHEINQPLGSALNYLYGLIQRLKNDNVDLTDIIFGGTQAIKQIERASSVIQHIHNFTRQHTPQVRTVDLNVLIQEIITFAEVDFRRFNTRLQTRLSKSPLIVAVNEIEIGQVILNLIKNGIDAMQELPADQRVLTIETENDLTHVTVMVRDCGPGIPASAMAKVFEAFFTTKINGLGLGLAVSRTIVQAHDGTIWFDEAQRDTCGACINFKLPLRTAV